MVKAKCAACGDTLRADDAAGGREVRCRCGAMVRLPTATSRAVEDALRALDSKGIQRQHRPAERNVFSLGSAATPGSSSETKPPQERGTREVDRKRLWWFVGAGVGVVAAFLIWSSATPGTWEKEVEGEVQSAKTEGDQLASQGKVVGALKKYQQALRLTNGRTIHGGELKKTVEATRAARDRLVEQNRTALDKARTAGALVD